MELAIVARILVSKITKTKQKRIAMLVLSEMLQLTKKIKSLEEVQAKGTKVQAKITTKEHKQDKPQNDKNDWMLEMKSLMHPLQQVE
jgi:hypothetical protein